MAENRSVPWQLASDTALPNHAVSRRLYFMAETLPDGARNVRPVHAPVAKLGIVLAGDTPWEGGGVSAFCGSLVRLDDGRYRLYYTALSGRAMRLAVAESADSLYYTPGKAGGKRPGVKGRSIERARARQFCAILNSASRLDLASQAE